MSLQKQIEKYKKKLNAVILVHNYQPPEIQDIADFMGDSLELSKKAASTSADVIVFCGVDFMAETAKILSPNKTVLLPVKDATCPMADMITATELRSFKKEYPDAAVVSYVNTTAEVKAETDICCTSSNAIKIVREVESERVIFTPDKNLADYVSRNVDKQIIAWEGFCPIHDGIPLDKVKKTKEKYADAIFMAHPECRKEIIDIADYITSTAQMFDVIEKTNIQNYIIGTEEGIIYPLKKRFPDKNFIPAAKGIICPNMKKMTLDKIIKSLETLSPAIELPLEIIEKAALSLKRMLALQ